MTDLHVGLFPHLVTIYQYFIGGVIGFLLDWLTQPRKQSKTLEGYAPFLSGFDAFYQRRLYTRVNDCYDRPIVGCPGAWVDVMERTRQFDATLNKKVPKPSGRNVKCLNLGSYNYLGFADPESPCAPLVIQSLHQYGASTSSFRSQIGTTPLHNELESTIARYVGKPAAMVFGMGFATNSTSIPLLVGPGGLIISDSLNHSSIVVGSRCSAAKIRVFQHGDMKSLEKTIRQAIIEGQPGTGKPWTKIVILVEGVYSMEGDFCPLPEIVELKKKYKCYLYVDEAHSIGALGRTGRGICEQKGVNPEDVDILMGTFTKSFGAVGGYVAGSPELINYMKRTCAGYVYSSSLSPPACQQVISAIRVITGEDGTDTGRKKLLQLKENSNYFRQRIIDMGCHVLGEWDSPVVPVLLCIPAKISAFSRECFNRGLAVVVVGFPATPLLLPRTRFCISASHTREDLDYALEKIEEVVTVCHIRYKKYFAG
eukprot:TRINITY_DN4174_c0_g1_i5.p1 TRINITY_DN4174_c0_g1~~TRINITY_DN4174_c0_g1_i5.p1  ORF type:complete len:482 (+),score=49.98 TRINITY_DN4174_c0_g1_i5:102-1547(+)